MRRSIRGQSLLEYVIFFVIIVAALLTIQVFMKRGVQGRWKDSVDQLGDQYDPGKMNGVVTHRLESTAESRVQTIRGTSNGVKGIYTERSDSSTLTETKNGSVQIAY